MGGKERGGGGDREIGNSIILTSQTDLIVAKAYLNITVLLLQFEITTRCVLGRYSSTH